MQKNTLELNYSEIMKLLIENDAEISISRNDDDSVSGVSIFTETTQFVEGKTYDESLHNFYTKLKIKDC